MTETKFTPGPWKWVKSNDHDWSSYDLSPGILTKDTADGTPFGDEIDKANAHLIAAAPELYEKLAKIRGWINVDAEGPWGKRFYAEVDALLAKARGEA